MGCDVVVMSSTAQGNHLIVAMNCAQLDVCMRVNFFLFFVLFYLPYLSSIHEKANCIAILWTGSPHSLGSCLFRGFYGPPVFHIKVGRPVKCLAQGHNKLTCRLVLHNLPEMPSAKQGSCGCHFLKSFGMTRQGE